MEYADILNKISGMLSVIIEIQKRMFKEKTVAVLPRKK